MKAGNNPARATDPDLRALQRRVAELELAALHSSVQRDAAIAVIAHDCPKRSFEEVLAVVCRLDRIDAGMVYVLNEGTRIFELAARHGLDDVAVRTIRSFPADEYPGRLAFCGDPGYYALNDRRYFPKQFDGLQGMHGVMILPVRLDDRVVATLNFATRSREPLPAETKRTIETLAVQISGVLAKRGIRQALGASRDSFQALFNSVQNMVFITDLNGRLLQYNPLVTEKLGYADDELRGVAVSTFCPESEREAACQSLRDLREGRRETCVLNVLTRGGETVPVEVTAARSSWTNEEAMFGMVRDLRGQLASERRIQESEEKYRSIVEGMTDYLFFIDPDGVFREYHCPGEIDHLLLPSAQFMGRKVVDCLPAHIVDDFEKAWSALRRGTRSREFEYTTGSAGDKWFRAMLVRRTDPAGAFLGATAHIRDITDDRRRDAELNAQRQRMELALRGGELGIWDINIRAGTIYGDRNLRRILGLNESTVFESLDAFRRMIHPADLSRISDEWEKYIRGETQILEGECRMEVGAGTWKWVLIRGAVNEIDENGVPVKMSGILLDIDEMRRVAQVAEERLRLMQILIDTIPSPIYYKDVAGRYLGCNRAFASLVRLESDEIIGRTVHELEAILNPAACEDADASLLHNPGVQVYDAPFPERDLSHRHYIYHKATFTNAEGALAGLVGVMIDISERKQNEEALRNAKDQAEALNRELSRSIEQANRLAVAAESANRAKSQFLANMSHEIRTPMNGIIGMAGLLLDSPLEGEEREFIQTILQSAEALMAIIDDILNLSQIESGKLVLERNTFVLRSLVEDLCSVLAVKAHDRKLNMACVIEPDVPSAIQGDPGRLRQVLVNLIGNAVKFTDEGEVTLQVARLPGSDANHLRFEVHDTGIGIPRDKREQLFEAFTQLDSSSTRLYGGSGLGLTISRRLVEMMGGEIGVESGENGGSLFWFEIRFGEAADIDIVEPMRGENLAGRQILIVDAHAANRRALISLFTESCCSEAADLDDMFAQLTAAESAGCPFDLVIVNQAQAGGNIRDLAGRIKLEHRMRASKLVITRPLGQRKDLDGLVPGLLDATLSMPVKARLVLDTLSGLFSGEAARTGAADADARAAASPPENADRPARRILVAEDNLINQRVALGILQKLGYDAKLVENGERAIEALRAERFEMVLMDLQMPEVDGLAATRRIRDGEAGDASREVPIIAMTAYAMEKDRELCLAAGMDDYLAKPVTVEKLAIKTNSWLRGQAPAAATARGSGR